MKLIEVMNACNGTLLNETLLPESFRSIKTDTRKLEPGDIFIALKGKQYDGHEYVEEAIKKGAVAIIVEQELKLNIPVIQVKSTYDALFCIGTLYLKTYHPTVIAVTGSVGKTTTKELIASFLESKYHVLKSLGNKNNRIGIPQTLFELNETIECLIVELGMNHLHEIEALSKLVKPDIALITNIGSAHIGNLGSKKNILKAKMEIVSGMNGGILLLNGHDKFLRKIKKIKNNKVETIYKEKGNIRIKLLEQTLFGSKILISDGITSDIVEFKNPGENVLEEIKLALHVGELLDVPCKDMIEILKRKQIQTHFDTKVKKDGTVLISDCYNSSYESLYMDFKLLEHTNKHNILILGDILELGKESKRIHKKIGKYLKTMKDTEVYLIGTEIKETKKVCKNAKYFIDKEEFSLYWMQQKVNPNSVILLKGSRKMKLEELIPIIESCEK